jgi:hypothetical protein
MAEYSPASSTDGLRAAELCHGIVEACLLADKMMPAGCEADCFGGIMGAA